MVFALNETVAPEREPASAVIAKVYRVEDFSFVKVYVDAVFAIILTVLVLPVVATTLMLVILFVGKASHEIFAVALVVYALTLVAVGRVVTASAPATPSSREVMTKMLAKRYFNECLTSSE